MQILLKNDIWIHRVLFCVSFVPLKQLVHIFILIYQTNTNRDNGFDKNCHDAARGCRGGNIRLRFIFAPIAFVVRGRIQMSHRISLQKQLCLSIFSTGRNCLKLQKGENYGAKITLYTVVQYSFRSFHVKWFSLTEMVIKEDFSMPLLHPGLYVRRYI